MKKQAKFQLPVFYSRVCHRHKFHITSVKKNNKGTELLIHNTTFYKVGVSWYAWSILRRGTNTETRYQ